MGSFGLDGNGDAGECFDAMEKCWIAVGAETGECLNLARIVGGFGGEHSGGGGGGHRETAALIDDGNSCASVSEFEGSRETNESGTNNDNSLICLVGRWDWIGDVVRCRHDLHYPAVIVLYAHVRESVRRYAMFVGCFQRQRRIGFQSLVFSRF